MTPELVDYINWKDDEGEIKAMEKSVNEVYESTFGCKEADITNAAIISSSDMQKIRQNVHSTKVEKKGNTERVNINDIDKLLIKHFMQQRLLDGVWMKFVRIYWSEEFDSNGNGSEMHTGGAKEYRVATVMEVEEGKVDEFLNILKFDSNSIATEVCDESGFNHNWQQLIAEKYDIFRSVNYNVNNSNDNNYLIPDMNKSILILGEQNCDSVLDDFIQLRDALSGINCYCSLVADVKKGYNKKYSDILKSLTAVVYTVVVSSDDKAKIVSNAELNQMFRIVEIIPNDEKKLDRPNVKELLSINSNASFIVHN